MAASEPVVLLVGRDGPARAELLDALAGGAVVHVTSTVDDAVAAMPSLAPDCVVVRVEQAPDVELVSGLLEAQPRAAVVVVGGDDDEAFAARALAAGAQHYLSQREALAPSLSTSVRCAVAEKRALLAASAARRAHKMEGIVRVTGTLAHDYANLLMVILTFGEALRDSIDEDDARREDMLEVLRAAESAREMTTKLLTFSRRRGGSPKSVDVKKLLAGLEARLAGMLGASIALEIDAGSVRWRAQVDGARLEEALLHLATNAREAMPGGGGLRIAARELAGAGEQVELTVSDTGAGMSDDVLERCFEPFFTTKEPPQGAGLGLAMVYAVVTGAGGDILVDTKPGRGTTFRLRLPRAEAGAEDAAVEGGAAGARKGGRYKKRPSD